MPKLVLTNAFFSINSVDLSNRVRSVSVEYSADEVEDTTMGADTHTALGGLKNWSMDIEFAQDFASGNVDATMFSLVGTQTTVEVRPVNASRSATNPGYTGTALVASYNPIGQSVGELATAPVRVRSAGTLSRATA